jgi:hypothetical protein
MGDLIAAHFSHRRLIKKQDPELLLNAAVLHIRKAQALLLRTQGASKEQAWVLEDLANNLIGSKSTRGQQTGASPKRR